MGISMPFYLRILLRDSWSEKALENALLRGRLEGVETLRLFSR